MDIIILYKTYIFILTFATGKISAVFIVKFSI